MSKYLILFIDEQEESRDDFSDKISDDTFEVKSIHPFATEEEMLSFISNEKFDAIIVDYGLMRNDVNIKYDGGDIINKVNEFREDFPAFILTGDIDQDDGVDEHVNPSIILLKSSLDSDLNGLKRKIKKSIKLYQKKNEDLSIEFNSLILKKSEQGERLEDADMERLKFLDEKIERRMVGSRKFPNLLENTENLQSLSNVLKDAEDFLKSNIKK